jgi:hypothetical protein
MPDEQQIPDDFPIKVNFRVPSRMPSVYAQHMTIQPGPNEVVLSFFEVVPPFLTAPSAEQIKHVQENGIVADCVARITVSPAAFPNFVTAMQEVLDRLTTVAEEQTEKNANDARDNPKG